MTGLSVSVMAHRRREHFVPPLLDKLGLSADRVTWDRRNDRWDTGRRAMLAHDPGASHHLVVQDDAVVPRDLVLGVESALAHIPEDALVVLYAGKTQKFWTGIARAGVQVSKGPCWLVMNQVHWGVGVVVPTERINEMVAWCDRADVPNYDKRISRWCEATKTAVWYPYPSLLEHRQSPSLVPGRGMRGRRAHRWIGEQTSVADLTWDRPVVRIPRLPDDPRRRRHASRMPQTVARSPKNPPARPPTLR